MGWTLPQYSKVWISNSIKDAPWAPNKSQTWKPFTSDWKAMEDIRKRLKRRQNSFMAIVHLNKCITYSCAGINLERKNIRLIWIFNWIPLYSFQTHKAKQPLWSFCLTGNILILDKTTFYWAGFLWYFIDMQGEQKHIRIHAFFQWYYHI